LTADGAAGQHRATGNDRVAPIRILLVAMPRLMRDIVEAQLLREPDMAVVGVAGTLDGLAREIRDSAPDFVLMGAGRDGSLEPLFEERPAMRVLSIEPANADADLYELRPHRVHLGQVSAREIVTAIRAAARTPRWDDV
jgi:DNA-binding NarL/FixJ family response regulator